MDIEAIVKKHSGTMWIHEARIRNALTELAAVYEHRIDALMVSHTEQVQELQRDKEYCCCGECTTLTPSTVGEREALQERIRQLEGTCNSLEEVLTDEEMDNDEITDAIDSQIFQCEYCS